MLWHCISILFFQLISSLLSSTNCLYILPFSFNSHGLFEILMTTLPALLENLRSTVDTYYRRCSSAGYVGNVSIPLLCVSALDDPVCTREAIPWDECRTNKNVVLATTKHGGHLAFFEGITATRLWWVRATGEFLRVLHSSQYMHVQNKVQLNQSTLLISLYYCYYGFLSSFVIIMNSGPKSPLDSTIDQGPFVSVVEDGMVAAVGNEQTRDNLVEEFSKTQKSHCENTDTVSVADQDEPGSQPESGFVSVIKEISGQATSIQDAKPPDTTPIKRCLDLLRRQNRFSIWLLAYIAIVTSWPLLGSAVRVLSRKKLRNVLPAALFRK
ncbi:hypothetical protein F8388_018789 [Cannabis sativa]|uniref:Uncharacterized protein n=1 Tax=Cannabis sativa TaxID=3483 RepID=A0A7J6GMD5_CANSA|nr:hypothetical protein F8388_018789 [Cannabis sativa]